jgi:hypothetical protein
MTSKALMPIAAPAGAVLCVPFALDTTTPAGKATFQMVGVFAEFERATRQTLPCASSIFTPDAGSPGC